MAVKVQAHFDSHFRYQYFSRVKNVCVRLNHQHMSFPTLVIIGFSNGGLFRQLYHSWDLTFLVVIQKGFHGSHGIIFSGSSQIHHLVLLELILAHQYNLLNHGGLVFLLFLLLPGGLRALSTEAREVLTKRMKYPKKWVSVLVCKCKS